MNNIIRISDRITLEIDTSDPDTPAMVYLAQHGSGTFNCVLDTGVIEDRTGYAHELTITELERLSRHQDAVDEAYNIARADWS